MKSEIIKFEDPIHKTICESVMITYDNGDMESFPVDESNPRYIQFLEEIS